MTSRMPSLLRLTALTAALALAACNGGADQNDLADLGNDADPALTSALNDQILVDPNLVNQSNRTAVRPPATPTQAQYPSPAPTGAGAGAAAAPAGNSTAPATGGAAAARARLASAPAAGTGGGAAGTGCTDPGRLDYNSAWARRMPAEFPLYPGARVTEAAGSSENGCRARIVTFASGDHWQRVLDWYHTRAVRSGYSSEHQVRGTDHVLAGTSGNGGAFYLIVTPSGSGSQVAMISNRGV
jgi:hypothetical protein